MRHSRTTLALAVPAPPPPPPPRAWNHRGAPVADGRGRGGVFARGLAAALLAAAGLFAAAPAAADNVGDTHYHFRVVLSSNTATEGQTGKITVRLQCVASSHAPCGSTHPGDSERNGGNMTITVTNPAGSDNGVTLSTNKVVGWTIAAQQAGVDNTFIYGTSNRGTVELTLQDNSTRDGTRQVVVSASFPYTPGVYWWYRAGGRDVRPRIQAATLVIEDDEAPSPELVVNEGSDNATAVTEAGSTDSFTVALSTNPSADVSVAVSVDSDDTGECEVSLDGGSNYLAAGTSGTLTFVPAGGSTTAARTTLWSTAQTVTVRAVDDDTGNEVDATCDVELDPSSTDTDYNGLSTVTVDVTVKDNERVLREHQGTGDGLDMTEGNTSEFFLAANQVVTEQVTIALSVTPVSPTVAADVTLSTTSLTIASGQTDTASFVVTAVDDNVDKGQNEYTFTINADATGGNVADFTFPTFRVTDNDDAAVVLSELASSSDPKETVTEAGGTATFNVALSTKPSAAVTVAVSSSDAGECRVSTAGSTTPAASKTLTFSATNWNTAQTVTLTGQDDDVDDGDVDCTITAAAASTNDAVYDSNTEVPDVTFTARNTDDEPTPTVALSVNPASISEDGGTATVRATLSGRSSQPTTVTVTAQANVFTVAGGTIVIAAGQTTTTDTATITAVDNDADAADNPVTVAGTAQNGHGVGAVTGASLTITDDDTAGLSVSPATSTASRLRTTEAGGTDTFTVALTSEPTGNVVLDVASSDTSEGTVDTSALTFTASTWDTAQTVTLTGQDDADTDGNQNYTVTLVVDQADTADADYDALGTVSVYVFNADDEVTADVNEDGTVDRNDALVLFYVYDFGPDLKDSASLRDAALRPRKGALAENDASYLQMITNAESWATAAPTGSDLNASGSVDRDDALVMFYVYDFGPDLKDSASLRDAALRPRKGALAENDASYLQMITAAERLAGASP